MQGVRKSMLIVSVFALLCPVCGAQDQDDLDRVMFSDEREAVRRVEADPSSENIRALAEVRARHAIRWAKRAEDKQEEDAHAMALMYAESAVYLQPENASYWLMVGSLYAEAQDGPRAILLAEHALEKAVELDPDLTHAQLYLGQVLLGQERYDRALTAFEAALRKDPDLAVPPIVSAMVAAYSLDVQEQRGVAFFRELLDRDPKATVLRFGLAILLQENEETEEAVAVLRKVVRNRRASRENRAYAKRLMQEFQGEGGGR